MTRWRCVLCGRFTHERLICDRCIWNYDIWDDMGYIREPFWTIKYNEQLIKDGVMSLDEFYEKYYGKR